MSNSKSNPSNPKVQVPNWDSAPKPQDEDKAKKLIQLMDGSADDYERNMVRIDMWLAGIQQAIGTAIKIAAIA